MVIGEHAVVYGYPAIVCAIDQRVTVEMRTRSDDLMHIETPVALPFTGRAEALPKDGPLTYVAAVLRTRAPDRAGGLDISITSEVDPTLGLGSSAAVTIALLGALNAIDQGRLPPDALHARALEVVRRIQGRGSGADLAASLYGGSLAYQIPADSAAKVEPLPPPPALSLRYCGYKTPTGEVLTKVAAARSGQEARFDALYDCMGHTAAQAISAAQSQDWGGVAQAMTEYQTLMQELGVSDDTLDAIIASAECARAAKISGSGLGDCVLALGPTPTGFTPVQIATRGLVVHE